MEGSGEEEEDFLFLVSLLLRFDFGWGSRASYSREYSWKLLRKTRGTEKEVVSPSFPATASSRPQITQVLAYLHLVFPTSPLSVSLKQTTGTQARLTLESKAFYHLRAPLFILSLVGWWQTNGAYPRSDLFEGTCLLRMKN